MAKRKALASGGRWAIRVYVTSLDQNAPYEDALYEAGCDDATIVVRDGEMHLSFDRNASSFDTAVSSAVHDIEKAGGRVLRVERIED